MPKLWISGTAMLLASCVPATMAGFSEIAAQPGAEQVDIRAIPFWKDGNFRVGNSQGSVRRVARDLAIGRGWEFLTLIPDVPGFMQGENTGRMTFTIAHPDLGGRAEARWVYSRGDARLGLGNVRLATATEPLAFNCRYQIDGRDAGAIRLYANPEDGASLTDGRTGEIVIDGTKLELETQHGIAEINAGAYGTTGYVMVDGESQAVGALELTGGNSQRAVLPNDPAKRRAALLAAITLALFWDPGDVG